MSMVICQNKDQILPAIKQGTILEVKYTLVNAGLEPVAIEHVYTRCGCTVGTFSKIMIPPNGETEIILSFNSAGRINLQKKYAVVEGTFQPALKLTFEVLIEL